MGKQITIKSGYSRVILPNGRAYDAGQTPILSDADAAKIPARMLTYVTIGATVPDPPTSGGGGGSVSPAQVREVVMETLVPGEGINFTAEDDTLEISNIVKTSVATRVYESATLLYATQFEGGVVPAWVSYLANANGGSAVVGAPPAITSVSGTTGTNKPAAYETALRNAYLTTVNTTTGMYVETILDLAAIPAVLSSGKTPTQVKVWASFDRPGSTGLTGTISTGVVTRRTETPATSGASAPWALTDTVLESSKKIALRTTRTANAGAIPSNAGWVITGLEVYGTSVPYMVTDVVLYQGNYYRSKQDNNPHLPNSGIGWELV